VFKRVLLCFDGTEVGRRALLRGAELAILLRAHVYVLSIIPADVSDPIIAAGAVGSASFIDEPGEYHRLLDGSLAWLRERGVTCEGFLASGNVIDEIAGFSQRQRIDLIVLGHYPQPTGGFWWSAGQRGTLAERTKCCIFVAVNAASPPDPLPP
jgi:nucleotide-binding universal stress UspA family protein